MKLLVVEDDFDVITSIEKLLINLKIDHQTATRPEEAVILLKKDSSFTLFLTDFDLKGTLTGLELISIAEDQIPGIKCCLMSGDFKEENVPLGLPFLKKPFTISELFNFLEPFITERSISQTAKQV